MRRIAEWGGVVALCWVIYAVAYAQGSEAQRRRHRAVELDRRQVINSNWLRSVSN